MSPPRLPPTSRYELLLRLAAGGMATVYIGRIKGARGFSRLVAIKAAHEHVAADPEQRHTIVQEARVASKIHHPNVVAVQDVEELDDNLLLVMDYVEGASFSELLSAARNAESRIAPAVAVRVVLDACAGLFAAHSLTDDVGAPLGLVHRDVSPQNVLVGVDGVARIADFGIAKPIGHRSLETSSGTLKGKLAYMAPEYVSGMTPDARADVFAIGIVLWEALAGDRLFRGANEAETMRRVLEHPAPRLSETNRSIPRELDDVLQHALAKDPAKRFHSTEAFASSLERATRAYDLVARSPEVAAEVQRYLGEKLARRREELRRLLGDAAAAPPQKTPLVPNDTVTMNAVPSELSGADEAPTRIHTVRGSPPGEAPSGLVDVPAHAELSTMGRSGLSAQSRTSSKPSTGSGWLWAVAALGVGALAAVGLRVLVMSEPLPSSAASSAGSATAAADPVGDASDGAPSSTPPDPPEQPAPSAELTASASPDPSVVPPAATSARPESSAPPARPRASVIASSTPPKSTAAPASSQPAYAPNPYKR